MTDSGRNGFSAADIPESESEESGDQGDLKPAGERRTDSADCVAFAGAYGVKTEIDLVLSRRIIKIELGNRYHGSIRGICGYHVCSSIESASVVRASRSQMEQGVGRNACISIRHPYFDFIVGFEIAEKISGTSQGILPI